MPKNNLTGRVGVDDVADGQEVVKTRRANSVFDHQRLIITSAIHRGQNNRTAAIEDPLTLVRRLQISFRRVQCSEFISGVENGHAATTVDHNRLPFGTSWRCRRRDPWMGRSGGGKIRRNRVFDLFVG